MPREKYGTLLDESCITELELIENHDNSTAAARKGKESRVHVKALELIKRSEQGYDKCLNVCLQHVVINNHTRVTPNKGQLFEILNLSADCVDF